MTRRNLWLAFFAALMPASAFALQHNYLDTYDYRKIDEGWRNLQVQTDLRDPERGDSYFFNQTGIEYGASNLYTIGVYADFTEGVGFSAAHLLNRFRITESNAYPVDMAFQLELKDANDHKDQDKIEGLFLVSKDIREFNLTGNAIMQLNREIEANGDDEWDFDPALALAGAFRTGTNVTPSLELFIADDQSRLIPGAAIDITSTVRLNVGIAVGLEDEADDTQLKTLLKASF
jgi:hypothetical protein